MHNSELVYRGGVEGLYFGDFGYSFFSFFFSSVLFNGFFAGVYAGIGSEFEEIKVFMKNPRSWNEKSVVEKVCFFLIFFSVFVSVVFFFVLGIWFRKRIKEDCEKEVVGEKGKRCVY